jgi:hypothetical protein
VPNQRDSDERRPDSAAVEAALAAVPGILSTTTATDPDGVPVAVRIVLEPDADEVGVAATAHRILRLQFGVGLDPAHIQLLERSGPEPDVPQPRLRLVDEDVRLVLELGGAVGPLLAQIDAEQARYDTEVLQSAARHPAGAGPVTSGEDPVVDLSSDSDRLAISDLAVVVDPEETSVTVTLRRGRTDLVGSASGGGDPTSVLMTVAQATSYAVGAALGSGARLTVETAARVPAGTVEVVVVQVGWVGPEGYERLLGAAEVTDDLHRTTIRATLDAVNRRLALAFDR